MIAENETLISVVIPCYNCSKSLTELHSRLVSTFNSIKKNYEIIFVNDASPQNDWEIIKSLKEKDNSVKGINLSRNFGQHYAITAGLSETKGDWIVVMDGDLQDQPEEIVKLFAKTSEGYDVVLGVRFNRQDKFFKKLTSKLFYMLFNYMIGNELDNTVANFGMYRNIVIKNYLNMKEQSRLFPTFISWLGFKTAKVEIEHAQRLHGQSSYSLVKLVKLAVDSIVSHSNKPLRFSIKFGLLISLLSFIYGLWIIFKYIYFGTPVEGWSSLMVSIWFISGLLFLNLGIIGLYIGKIYEETKSRPLYIIKEIL